MAATRASTMLTFPRVRRWWLFFAAPGMLTAIASAKDASMPSCASNPPIPAHVVTVPGFPAERLYMDPAHPGLCNRGDDDRCKSNAYVISGDRAAGRSSRSAAAPPTWSRRAIKACCDSEEDHMPLDTD